MTDQTGKSRESVGDSLGRLTQIFEDPAGLNFETDCTCDALGNLLTVNQKGGSTGRGKVIHVVLRKVHGPGVSLHGPQHAHCTTIGLTSAG